MTASTHTRCARGDHLGCDVGQRVVCTLTDAPSVDDGMNAYKVCCGGSPGLVCWAACSVNIT
jgi:hypothetical protein